MRLRPNGTLTAQLFIKALDKTLKINFEDFEGEIAKNYNFFYKSKVGTYENSLKDLKNREK